MIYEFSRNLTISVCGLIMSFFLILVIIRNFMYSRNQFKEINAVIYNFKNFNIFYFFNYLNI